MLQGLPGPIVGLTSTSVRPYLAKTKARAWIKPTVTIVNAHRVRKLLIIFLGLNTRHISVWISSPFVRNRRYIPWNYGLVNFSLQLYFTTNIAGLQIEPRLNLSYLTPVIPEIPLNVCK